MNQKSVFIHLSLSCQPFGKTKIKWGKRMIQRIANKINSLHSGYLVDWKAVKNFKCLPLFLRTGDEQHSTNN
jgi:hypothetical protein